MGSLYRNISPVATFRRKSGKKKKKKWRSCSTVTINATSALVGGIPDIVTQDDAYAGGYDETEGVDNNDEDPLKDGNVNNLTAGERKDYQEDNTEGDDFLDQLFTPEWDPTGPDINKISFVLKDGNHLISLWYALQIEQNLYIELPHGEMPSGIKECFVSLLDYVEEELGVVNMFLCIPKLHESRGGLLRTFLFLGFEVVHNMKCGLVPSNDNYIFMAYSFE